MSDRSARYAGHSAAAGRQRDRAEPQAPAFPTLLLAGSLLVASNAIGIAYLNNQRSPPPIRRQKRQHKTDLFYTPDRLAIAPKSTSDSVRGLAKLREVAPTSGQVPLGRFRSSSHLAPARLPRQTTRRNERGRRHMPFETRSAIHRGPGRELTGDDARPSASRP